MLLTLQPVKHRYEIVIALCIYISTIAISHDYLYLGYKLSFVEMGKIKRILVESNYEFK